MEFEIGDRVFIKFLNGFISQESYKIIKINVEYLNIFTIYTLDTGLSYEKHSLILDKYYKNLKELLKNNN